MAADAAAAPKPVSSSRRLRAIVTSALLRSGTNALLVIQLALQQVMADRDCVAELEIRFVVAVIYRPRDKARAVRIARLDEIHPVARHRIGQLRILGGIGEPALARILRRHDV